MLKKIAVEQLRVGMHLHKLEGHWMAHPFWKSRFVLHSADDLQRVHSSGIAECWIDTRLGLDVAAPVCAATAAAVPAAPAVPQPSSPAAAPPVHRSMAEELKQAAAICDRAREVVVALFNEARMGHAVSVEGCLPLVDDIAGSVQRNPGALVSLARLKSRDDYSYMHSVAVCALMVALGRQLGQDDAQCRLAGQAGLLHDIGKALVPLELLNKPGRLTEEEFATVRTHSRKGYALLLEGQGAPPEVLDVVLHHHERPDGAGYPERLAGAQLSQMARMASVCDVYDAITSQRPYKTAWDPAESIAQMAAWKGQFDPVLLAAFVQSLGIYPTGSLVRLESGRLAVVAEQNPHKLVAPVVKVFFSTRSQMRIEPQRLDLALPGCSDRIAARHAAEGHTFGHLDELWADPALLRRRRQT